MLAAALAIIAGGRRGRQATSGKMPMREVEAAMALINTQVSKNRRW
ncbi:hypothetical protein BH24ACT7_BH24ACT7_14620 [soil metagenome]